jgi:hypothetical protein
MFAVFKVGMILVGITQLISSNREPHHHTNVGSVTQYTSPDVPEPKIFLNKPIIVENLALTHWSVTKKYASFVPLAS